MLLGAMTARNHSATPVIWLFAFGLLTSLAACKSASERQLVDTERRHFVAKCQRSGECSLTQTLGDKRSDSKTGLMLLRVGRLVGICDVAPGKAPETPADCRALVCQTDADCPPGHGLKDGQCLNAL